MEYSREQLKELIRTMTKGYLILEKSEEELVFFKLKKNRLELIINNFISKLGLKVLITDESKKELDDICNKYGLKGYQDAINCIIGIEKKGKDEDQVISLYFTPYYKREDYNKYRELLIHGIIDNSEKEFVGVLLRDWRIKKLLYEIDEFKLDNKKKDIHIVENILRFGFGTDKINYEFFDSRVNKNNKKDYDNLYLGFSMNKELYENS